MTDATAYDPHDLRKPRGKRISAITGKATKLSPELELQIQIVKHYDSLTRLDRALREGTRLYAVNPLPGSNARKGDLAKRAGVRAGVFDLALIDRRGGRFRYTWIEVKAAKGRRTPEQIAWAAWLTGTPVQTVDVRSLDEFLRILNTRS